MICTTIQNRTLEEILEILDRPDIGMAEIRLDKCPMDNEQIEELFSGSDVPLVATCRVSDEMTPAEAESKLITAVRSGAAYVDVEIEAPAMMAKRIRREAHECGTTLIRSYHDFEGTDSLMALEAICEKCRHLGGEIVKIVPTARNAQEAERVLQLYSSSEPGTLVAFAMGEDGKYTRLDCLKKGAPFTYAALSEEEAAAPGQWPYKEMNKAVWGEWLPIGYSSDPEKNPPVIKMPCSKSFAQRAIVAAALSEGTSVLRGYSPCGDNESAISLARELGADITADGRTITIKGTGGKEFSGKTIHTGESGFLTRMMIPILSKICKEEVLVTGEKTLLRRPLKGAIRMMETFGVTLESEGQVPEMIPLHIKGHLSPRPDAIISGKDGSQLVSGLLAALPLCEEDTVLRLTDPKSIPYIYITIDVLKQFGIRIESEMEGGEDFMETQDWSLCEAITFRIKGGQRYKAADIDLEADWSSAAPFLVAGAVFGKVEIEGLDTKSLQADLSILDILAQAGASLCQIDVSGNIRAQRAPLCSFDVDASNCPDLFPVISVLAAFCQGRSQIGGVGRLAGKESDRAKAILDMLTKMGVRAFIKGDNLIIDGMSLAQRCLLGKLLKGGAYSSSHDHRMVMALKVASIGADGPIIIDDEECVEKSFPDFHDVFSVATGK